jgi:hypothetical protein
MRRGLLIVWITLLLMALPRTSEATNWVTTYHRAHITADIGVGPGYAAAVFGGGLLLAKWSRGAALTLPALATPNFMLAGSAMRARTALIEEGARVGSLFGYASWGANIAFVALAIWTALESDNWVGSTALLTAALLGTYALGAICGGIQWAINENAWSNQLGHDPLGWPVTEVTWTIIELVAEFG